MAYKVVKLNYDELQLWNAGKYVKCGHIRKVSFEYNEEVEIRNAHNERLAYAKVLSVEKQEATFEPLFLGTAYQEAFEANLPQAPLVTLMVFELLTDWEVQE